MFCWHHCITYISYYTLPNHNTTHNLHFINYDNTYSIIHLYIQGAFRSYLGWLYHFITTMHLIHRIINDKTIVNNRNALPNLFHYNNVIKNKCINNVNLM